MTTIPSPQTQAWSAGWDAFLEGKPNDPPPDVQYPDDWREGWMEAQSDPDPDEEETPTDDPADPSQPRPSQ